MRRHVAAVVAVIGVMAAACGNDSGESSERGLVDVSASFYPVAEAAARVGGDRANVSNVTPPGAEPHEIELTSRQVDALESADVVVYFGAGFQPAIEEVAKRADGIAIDLLEDADLRSGPGDDQDGDEALDPHIWLDPTRMMGIAERVRDALIEADPEGKVAYRANADAFIAELRALDADFVAGLAHCDRDTIVTAHASFGYLASRYELRQKAIAGLSPESEPDPKRLATLTDEVRAGGITTIFYETLVAPDIAETLAREAGVETAVLNPLEGLTDEQLDRGATYETVMRENLGTLRSALGCR